ncbi:MAG: hypothetical protein COU07_00870 [Candidatus Harrisonbacteria bacterium CG10_big_fil_rev_8_21_14_0_10_40_38]|uniref:Uncharacterized protein n=1 Tax=Candidatus Harrisonbacteria bacterium CG10_big_fil_rev_8_21_14_0_10_40_38 TaxID=1974583 RepID=A0A2H0USP8_9BACT|nr:MAG: hypothetical protein COU07_00870 [Candidatus Harrisonbacteria bacterium CG10_big_fil_rev_8_21_14_0_10_40_38]
MKPFEREGEEYFKTLKDRGKTSKVHRSYQLIGLEIADILSDRGHKSLYIKMAKEMDQNRLLEIAKSVIERKDVKNPGAYFMRLIEIEKSGKNKKV